MPATTKKARGGETQTTQAAARSRERVVKALEIAEVVAESVTCAVNHDRMKDGRRAKRTIRISLRDETVSASKKGVVFRFSLDVETEEPEAPPQDRLLSLQLVYRCTYELNSSRLPSESEIEKYRRTYAVLHVLPFLRAHVADLTLRTGLPPFLLPLYRKEQEQDGGQ